MAPEPPEGGARDLPAAPASAATTVRGPIEDDSDEDMDYYEGYEPLPLAPVEEGDLATWNSNLMSDSEDEEDMDQPGPSEILQEPDEAAASAQPVNEAIPAIETVDREVTREVWTRPRQVPNIDMDAEKAQEVMSAMANFSLPPSSFPEWARSISEEEWRRQLATRLNSNQDNR